MAFNFDEARRIMVDSQVRTADVTDLAIQRAMRQAPREVCCPPDKAALAYADTEVEYAPGRWLMRPRDVAKMLQAVGPRPGEMALAIAAPYAAMVLEAIGLKVTRCDDELKTPPGGGYDVIVCEGSVCECPKTWPAALAEGGRLAVVVRTGAAGRLRLYVKAAGETGFRGVFEAAPPILAGFEPEVGFTF